MRLRNRLEREGGADAMAIREAWREMRLAHTGAWIDHMHRARHGFAERLAMFWGNHFAVSARGQQLDTLRAAYENDVIRRHALGRFEDLAYAAVTHPAMLIYLDNVVSFGPNSPAGRRNGRGLNENLGRELLELHTLGVGAYDQADVTALAAALTGWTVADPVRWPQHRGKGIFVDARHEPGPHTLLGKRYDAPPRELLRAIVRDLARRPETAAHVAKEMATAFVGDEPPFELLQALARAFLDTGGDLRAVAAALVTSDEAWRSPPRTVPPRDFVIAFARAFLLPGDVPPARLAAESQRLGQRLWTAPSPDGFDEAGRAWLGPVNLRLRLDLAHRLLRRVAGRHDPRVLAVRLLGDGLSEETRLTVERAGDPHQALTLLAMAPEMQRR